MKSPDDNIGGIDGDAQFVETDYEDYEDIENDSEEDTSDW